VVAGSNPAAPTNSADQPCSIGTRIQSRPVVDVSWQRSTRFALEC
jgi:hypothetical protein